MFVLLSFHSNHFIDCSVQLKKKEKNLLKPVLIISAWNDCDEQHSQHFWRFSFTFSLCNKNKSIDTRNNVNIQNADIFEIIYFNAWDDSAINSFSITFNG